MLIQKLNDALDELLIIFLSQCACLLAADNFCINNVQKCIGKQIADGKKSISYSISMRSHDGTLKDEQAESAMKKVIKSLAEIGAELRM